MKHRKTPAMLIVLSVVIGGCASNYVTPGQGVSLYRELAADEDVRIHYQTQPASPYPANIAIVRVQDSGYRTRTNYGYGEGRFSIVTTRDIESAESVEKIRRLPLIANIAPIGRVLVPSNANSLMDLRTPAAMLHADMLLIYSVSTSFTVDGKSLGPLSLISLGLIPNKKAHVAATVSGVLMDVRTGYVYGTTEATAMEQQRATIWSTETAIDTARLRAEEQAFGEFVDGFQDFWANVVNVYAATGQVARSVPRLGPPYYPTTSNKQYPEKRDGWYRPFDSKNRH